MALTDDEYSCLMIMGQGQNLIRMRDTRWYAPLTSLQAKGFCKSIGNENFVISAEGEAALAEHETGLEDDLRLTLNAGRRLNNVRTHMLSCLNDATNSVVSAARAAHEATGESFPSAINKILDEIRIAAGKATQ